MRRAGVVAVVAVLVLAMGLAGTAFAKPLSKRAYIKAADPALWQDKSARDSLTARVSEGSGINLGLDKLKQRLAAL